MGKADTELHFACQKCTARLTAPRRRAGTKGRCPWCLEVFTVPMESRAPFAGETYAIEDRPWSEDLHQHESHVAFTCPLCGTRMVASEQQVGEEMACPDCETKTIVPAPAQIIAQDGPAADVKEGYALCADPGQPSAGSIAYQQYYAVHCPVCQTRLHATPDEAGSTMVCPDCRKGFVVPPPPPPKAALELDPVDAYDLRPVEDRPSDPDPAEPEPDGGPPRPPRKKSRERGSRGREHVAESGDLVSDEGPPRPPRKKTRERGARWREQVDESGDLESDEGPPRPEKKAREKHRRQTIRKRSARPTLPAHPFLSGVLRSHSIRQCGSVGCVGAALQAAWRMGWR